MSYRTLQFACYCGQPPERILEIGFTSDRNLVVHFWCSSCHRVLFITQSLEDCEKACPPPDAWANSLAAVEDARFLQSLGIATG